MNKKEALDRIVSFCPGYVYKFKRFSLYHVLPWCWCCFRIPYVFKQFREFSYGEGGEYKQLESTMNYYTCCPVCGSVDHTQCCGGGL